MWASLAALVRRDLRLVMRQGGDWLNPLCFFVMVLALFPPLWFWVMHRELDRGSRGPSVQAELV